MSSSLPEKNKAEQSATDHDDPDDYLEKNKTKQHDDDPDGSGNFDDSSNFDDFGELDDYGESYCFG